MDLDRFKKCSAAYGAERRRWPQREQPLYDRFSNTSEGLAILAEAARTDQFLDTFELAPADSLRVRQVYARARPAWHRLGKATAALAASAVLGFLVGYFQVHGTSDAGAVAQLLLGPNSLQEIGL